MKFNLIILLLLLFQIHSEFGTCKLKNSAGVCIGCESNYQLLNAKCIKKIDYCLNYDDNGCIECTYSELQEDGTCKFCDYALDIFGMTCIQKVENCDFNMGSIQMPCRQCKKNYQITEEGTKCVPCESGKISNGLQCKDQNFEDHCQSYYPFSESCSVCESGYSLSQDLLKCTKCKDNEVAPFGQCIKTIENCEKYSEDGKCESCYNNYPLNTDKTICASYGINKCLEYNEDSTCKTCNSYYKLNQLKTSCDLCTSPGENDENGNFCFGIENCDKYEKNAIHCKSCYSGYKLSTDKKSCIQCESGSVSDGINCYEKIENCGSDFNYVKNEQIFCQSCESDYILSSNKRQCTNCPKGKYLYNGNCINELKGCLDYSSETTCSKCLSNYILSNGKCEKCSGSYVLIENNICVPKIDRCSQYEADGTCTLYFSEALFGPFNEKSSENSKNDDNDNNNDKEKNKNTKDENYGKIISFNHILILIFIIFIF